MCVCVWKGGAHTVSSHFYVSVSQSARRGTGGNSSFEGLADCTPFPALTQTRLERLSACGLIIVNLTGATQVERRGCWMVRVHVFASAPFDGGDYEPCVQGQIKCRRERGSEKDTRPEFPP